MPRPSWISLNWWTPKNTWRSTRTDQVSPRASSAPTIEQRSRSMFGTGIWLPTTDVTATTYLGSVDRSRVVAYCRPEFDRRTEIPAEERGVMRYGTIRLRKFSGAVAPRAAWRGWAGPVSPSIADSDL